jgi:ABC-type Fe3+/spermidine/putrescine transport system ATPase subunit
MNYLEIRDLRFTRPGFSLAADVWLEKGETAVMLGPSGCGKTSFLRCIAGLEAMDSGSISLAGRELSGLPPERRGIGFVFQDLALFDHLSGKENIGYGLRLRKVPKMRRERIVAELSETLKITPLLERKPATLSGGERQRLAFARAIAYDPPLLLLDEPLSSLDAPLRKELRSFLRFMLKERGITSIHVTHDVEEAFELADRIFLMREGSIVASAKPETLFAKPPDAWCVRFLGLGSLVPILGREGDAVITNLGRMRVPSSPDAKDDKRRSTPDPGLPQLLFIPRSAVQVGDSSHSAMEFRVEWEIFRGESRRLGLRRAGILVECDVAAVLESSVGQTLWASFDSTQCMIVS